MIKSLNEVLSFFVELAMLIAFAYAGFHFGNSKAIHYLLGIGIPVLIIIFWAKKMAPKAPNRLSYPWLLIVSFILFEASAVALYFSGITQWSIVLAVVALVNVGLKFVFRNAETSRHFVE